MLYRSLAIDLAPVPALQPSLCSVVTLSCLHAQEKDNLERANSRLDTSVSESNRLLKTLTMEYETSTSRLMESERIVDRLKRDHAYAKVCFVAYNRNA